MKKVISILLSVALIFSTLFIGSFNAFAWNPAYNSSYTYNAKTKVLTITGPEVLVDYAFSWPFSTNYTPYDTIYPDCYEFEDYPPLDWDNDLESATKIVISEGVKEIGEGCFWGMWAFRQLTTVELPSTLEKIGDYAFYSLNNLKTVTIPSGSKLKEIGRGAFLETNLSSISLPSGLEYIGPYAFGDTPLTSLTIPKTVNNLCNVAYNCNKLSVISILGDSSYHCVATNCPKLKSVIFYSTNNRQYTHETEKVFLENCPNAVVYMQKKAEKLKAVCEHNDVKYEIVSKPSTVKNLKVKSTTASTVSLTWSKSSNCSAYQVQRYIVSKKQWKTLATVTTNSCTLKNLAAACNLKFRVRAIKKLPAGSFNGDFSQTVIGTTKPETPTIKTPTTNSKHQITVKWNKVPSGAGYQVQYSTKKNFSSITASKTVSGISKTSYTGKGFKKGKTYYVRVRAYKTYNGTKHYGAWSSVKSIKCK